jgi:hypothetical protein
MLSHGASTTQNAAAPLFSEPITAGSQTLSTAAEAAVDAVASAAPTFAAAASESPVFAANVWEFGLWPHSVPILNNLPAAVEVALRATHDFTGLPWWATIAVVGLSMRLCIFPMTMKTMKAVATIKKMDVAAQPYKDAVQKAKTDMDVDQMRSTQADLKEFYMRVRSQRAGGNCSLGLARHARTPPIPQPPIPQSPTPFPSPPSLCGSPVMLFSLSLLSTLSLSTLSLSTCLPLPLSLSLSLSLSTSCCLVWLWRRCL